MEIKGVSNSPLFVEQTKKTKPGQVQSQEQKDKIQISSEARDLAKTDLSPERLNEIRQRISSGFYNSNEVLEKIAEKLSVDLAK